MRDLTIGFLPLVDACLPILAREHGFAEAEGLSTCLAKLPESRAALAAAGSVYLMSTDGESLGETTVILGQAIGDRVLSEGKRE